MGQVERDGAGETDLARIVLGDRTLHFLLLIHQVLADVQTLDQVVGAEQSRQRHVALAAGILELGRVEFAAELRLRLDLVGCLMLGLHRNPLLSLAVKIQVVRRARAERSEVDGRRLAGQPAVLNQAYGVGVYHDHLVGFAVNQVADFRIRGVGRDPAQHPAGVRVDYRNHGLMAPVCVGGIDDQVAGAIAMIRQGQGVAPRIHR